VLRGADFRFIEMLYVLIGKKRPLLEGGEGVR
jgi:hypothetical protein